MTQYVSRAHEGLTCPIAPLFNRAGEQKLVEVISLRDQEVSDQKVCLIRAGDATDGDGTDGTLEVAWISVSSQPGDLLLLLFF